MPRFRSTYFLNSAKAQAKKQKNVSVGINKQVDDVMRNLEKVLIDYSEKDRKKITRKAAQKIATAARAAPGFKDSKRPHYRIARGDNKITYNPGNLRKSLKVISLRKSNDAFVGPQFAKKASREYGGAGQPVDGYYAAMLYGSGAAFISRVLVPALKRGGPAAQKVLIKESEKAIAKRGVRRGFKTR
jgi:hypothetical protein